MSTPSSPTMKAPPTHRLTAEELKGALADAGERTLSLLEGLSPEQVRGFQKPGLNPLWWEIGHIAWFHEKFILRNLDGSEPLRPDADAYFDSFKVGHEERWSLASSDLSEPVDYLNRVRRALMDRLPEGRAGEADSYFYQLTTFHEDMHNEAFTYTRQHLGCPKPRLGKVGAARELDAGTLEGDVAVPGGTHLLGSDESVPFRFDNEKQPHEVEFAGFRIARAPVTNEAFARFIADGGYHRQELWSHEGWAWRSENGITAPAYWEPDGQGGWLVRWFDTKVPLRPHHPVVHVSWYEAEAYCRWAGRRLPTEIEWEVAASREWDASGRQLTPRKRLFPWGHEQPTLETANLDGYLLGCVDVGAFPGGDSGVGCRQMLGNVWEWTSSPFAPYPGFTPDPYQEYSQPWFEKGDNRVIRGGCWTTRSRMVNGNHRNFFTPDRRDIYAGFRTCAAD